MTQFSLGNLRFILDTEDQNDKPSSEELMQQTRENIEVLFMLLVDTGQSGSATSDPPDDTTGVLTDTGASYDTDEHNGRTLLITSGTAKNMTFTIDDTTATTLVCTGDNLYSAGVRSGDTYKIFYDVKVNADGHDHDGVNSPLLTDGAISQAKLKTTEHEQSSTTTSFIPKTLSYAEYGFECRVKAVGGSVNEFKRSDGTDPTPVGASYAGERVWIKADSAATVYVKYRYVTASGEVFWLWLLRDKTTKQVIYGDAASDHCSFGRNDPAEREQPFDDQYDPAQHEIVLINPSKEELKAIYERANGRGLLQTFLEDYEIDDAMDKEWPNALVTTRIKNDDWFERYIRNEPVVIERNLVPKVDYVLCKGFKEKAKAGP